MHGSRLHGGTAPAPPGWTPNGPWLGIPGTTRASFTNAFSCLIQAEAATPREEEERGAPPSNKRPAESAVAEDPSLRKRNRRMFGALLGTLNKFRCAASRATW